MSRLFVCLIVACTTVAEAAEPGTKTIVIVRHAESEPEAAGPQRKLSARGARRARELARVLGEAPLSAIYSTVLARTRLTAEPLARVAGAPLIPFETTDKTLAALAEAPWGTTLVVVGHSNTVPQLVAGLTKQPYPASDPVTHDQMWLVTLTREGGAATLRMRYGAPDDAPPAHK